MKRILSILTLLLVSLFVNAADFFKDGIYYNIISKDEKTVEVTNNGNGNTYNGDISIPKEVEYNGNVYSVISIGQRAFGWCSELTLLPFQTVLYP